MRTDGPAPALELALLDSMLHRLGYLSVLNGPHEQLEVPLAGDRESGSDRLASRSMIVRVTGGADGAEATRLVTFSTDYSFDAVDTGVDAARLACSIATQYLVLGHLETDTDGTLHLRYSMLVDSTAPPSDDVIAQVVSLLDYQQLHFGDYLEAFCDGDVPVADFDEFVGRGEQLEID